tara:strand:+ start:2585 stop:3361 length:777 start_codon:yes stop_codon:yes gene_type:complete
MIRGYFKIIALWLVKFFSSNKPHVFVLMYHSVSGGDTKYDVPKTLFEKELKFLAQKHSVVSLSNVVAYAKGERKIERSEIAITIDDGYLDTYTNVFPLLKKYNVHATVFLTSNLERKEKLGDIERLTKEQIKEMSDSGLVSFEIHGRNHLNLKEISNEEFEAEVAGCRDDIISYTGHAPKYIAYASGHRNKEIEDRVEGLGLVAGFGITEGIINPGDNLYRLRRVQIDRTMPFALFKLRTTRAVHLYKKILSWLRGKK